MKMPIYYYPMHLSICKDPAGLTIHRLVMMLFLCSCSCLSFKFSFQSIEIAKSVIISRCSNITDKIAKQYTPIKVNKFEIIPDNDVSVSDLYSNPSQVAKQLDEISKNPKKLMCINDDHSN